MPILPHLSKELNVRSSFPIVVNYNNVICLQCPVEFKRALLSLLPSSSFPNVQYIYFMDLSPYIKYSLNLGLR